jgi:cholesterol transport system auxiliary component
MRTAVNLPVNPVRAVRALALLALALVLAGCAATRGNEPNVSYDFGPLPVAASTSTTHSVPILVVTDAVGPQALDSQAMLYRLLYADPLQARAYANNRWSSTPLQLLTQRFKTRIAQAGIKVLAVTDATSSVLLMRIEVDDFSHVFETPANNHGQLVLRASIFQGHKLIDQKTFSAKVASSSADAAGGTRALATAADNVARDILLWLAALPPRS